MKQSVTSGIGQDASLKSYLKIFFWVLFIALINHQLNIYLGYRATGFIFLMFVTVCGLFFSFGPVLLAATLSALTWNYFFIPPKGTFIIHSPEDAMMFFTYFVTASVSGLLTYQIKKNQIALQNREEKTRELYEVLNSMSEAAKNAVLLKESEKLHQTLLNCISHELRTPLTAIMGAASALGSQSQADAKSIALLTEEIVASSERLNGVFENLLDMTRLESGMIKLREEWFDLAELVNFTLEKQQRLLAEHRVHFSSTSDPLYFYGDYDLLEHALANLLLNAAKYSPVGSEIKITAMKRRAELVLEVADQGPGIAESLILHIFDKFYRVPGTASGGLGLGLSIAKNLVELHQGKIGVMNLEERGSVFFITLPYLEPPKIVQESQI